MIDAESYRDDLMRFGLHKVAHQEVTLLNHMFRACEILQDMNAQDDICLAALFHGVFGTEALHNDNVDDIPEHRRAAVRAVVGPTVEQLIFNFSVMSYTSLGSSFRKLLRPNGQPELKDRRTGVDIALDRAGFEQLLQMKLGDVLAHMPEQESYFHHNLPVEHADFWMLAAEHLGPDAVNTWNKYTRGRLWIDTDPS